MARRKKKHNNLFEGRRSICAFLIYSAFWIFDMFFEVCTYRDDKKQFQL